MLRAKGPFEVLEKVNDAYEVDLPGNFGVLATCIVAYLSPYLQDDYLVDLKSKFSQRGEDDGGPSSQHNMDTQISQESLHISSKVQDMSHILLGTQIESLGFNSL